MMTLSTRLLGAEEAKFSGGAVCAKAVWEVEGGSGAGGEWGHVSGRAGRISTEGEEAGGFVEAEAGAQLTGGGSDDAATEGGVKSPEAVEFDGDGGLARGGADCSAASANGFAGEEKLGEDAGEFGLPAGFFFPGEFGEVGQG